MLFRSKELYVEFDFEAAQRELGKAEVAISNDFFLAEFKDEFLENARYLISEAYCRIHQRIDIGCVHSPVARLLAVLTLCSSLA